MPALVLFLLLSQTQPSQDYVGRLPNFALTAEQHQRNRWHLNGPQAPENQILLSLDDRIYSDLLGENTCFTMRSYVFSRQDGHFPVLVGTTTCTPANTLRMERSKRPQVRLVPAD